MTSDRLSATFAALSDPTRRAILARLATGTTPVTALAEPFDMSLPAVSKHLKVLERELVITRVFDAPRRLVFKTWTEPERLVRWWGPKGFTMPACAMDVRPGGA